MGVTIGAQSNTTMQQTYSQLQLFLNAVVRIERENERAIRGVSLPSRLLARGKRHKNTSSGAADVKEVSKKEQEKEKQSQQDDDQQHAISSPQREAAIVTHAIDRFGAAG